MEFTESHVWIAVREEGIARVGMSRYARQELGEIVYVELPAVGLKLKTNDAACVLESTKAAVDIYAPAAGEVIAVNERLRERVDALNQDPEGEGWLFEMSLAEEGGNNG